MFENMLRPATRDPIIFVGGGRNAHNLLGLLEVAGVRVAAILDDCPGGEVLGHSVLPVEGYEGPEWAAMLTIMDPETRRRMVNRPALASCVWTSYLDPRSAVSPYAKLGTGVIIYPFVMCADAELGDHSMVFPNSAVGARAKVGSFSAILPNATVASDAVIGSNCVLGSGARIAAGVSVGDGCRVSSNAVVRKDVPANSIVTPSGQVRGIIRPVRPA